MKPQPCFAKKIRFNHKYFPLDQTHGLNKIDLSEESNKYCNKTIVLQELLQIQFQMQKIDNCYSRTITVKQVIRVFLFVESLL